MFTQALTALLYNLNLKGLLHGTIRKGWSKSLCVPGLNCYSCPAAVSSCPLGALQSTLATAGRGINLAVTGFLLAFAALFGRFVCGWLCPFGLLQELLYRIPVRKRRTALRRLRFAKYAVLIVLVLAVPVLGAAGTGVGVPAFCKYLCPDGTIAGLLLIGGDPAMADRIGIRFAWKILVLLVIAALSAVIFRPFCRILCPLGAIYGLFNRIALFRIRCDTAGCTSCSRCHNVCPAGLSPEQEIDSPECIRCGKCVSECPENALRIVTPADGLRKRQA